MMLLLRGWRPALAALGWGLLLTACSYDNKEDLTKDDPAPDCDPTASTYAATIAPLLQQRCVNCHRNSQSGNIAFQTHAQAQAAAQSGRLLGAVRHAAGYQAMPPNGAKLSDCEISHIQRWVDAGAPNN
jgi:cytochrome c5